MSALRHHGASARERRASPRRRVSIPAFVGRQTYNPRLDGFRFGTIVDVSEKGLGLRLELRHGTLEDVIDQLCLTEIMFPCPGTNAILSFSCRIRHLVGENWATRAGGEIVALPKYARQALVGWEREPA
jgi:hypothetical protein